MRENSDKLIEADKLVKVEENKKTHNVVSILRHGDHWHVYTSDGREFITYSDPSSDYPGVSVGIYHGSHGDQKVKPEKENGGKVENQNQENSSEDRPTNAAEDRKTRIGKLKITNILGQEEVDPYDIVKILKHEDHYHIYDSKGREGVTYENPQDLYPNASFGQYEEVIQTRTKIRIRSIGQKELQKLLTTATTGTSIRAIKKLELSQKTQKSLSRC